MKKIFLSILAAVSMTANAQNPYLPLWEHLPDGEPRVFEDPDNPGKLRAYIGAMRVLSSLTMLVDSGI